LCEREKEPLGLLRSALGSQKAEQKMGTIPVITGTQIKLRVEKKKNIARKRTTNNIDGGGKGSRLPRNKTKKSKAGRWGGVFSSPRKGGIEKLPGE